MGMTAAVERRHHASLAKASLREAATVLTRVLVPTIAKGVIIRRPSMVELAERLDLDRGAIRTLQRLRERHGDGPVIIRVPGRTQAILLAPADVRRVLEGTPEPFATDSSEKHAALSHFEPDGVLISRGVARTERRELNEAVLDSGCPRHRLAARFASIVQEEAGALVAAAREVGTLEWSAFASAWNRIVRRVVLGDGARDDEELTRILARLRQDANWAFLHRKRRALYATFATRLTLHLERAERGSLAHVMANTYTKPDAAPAGQVPQWLFAFDSAGIATYRALALLATHPEQAARALADLGESDGAVAPELPFVRACVLESVRLWPTTPMILRQSTAATTWDGVTMPAGTGVLIFAPYFHRDSTRLPFADRFTPEIWLQGTPERELGIVPFSEGPAQCPGREIVLLLASTTLATLMRDGVPRVAASKLNAAMPMPGTLDNYTLRFEYASYGDAAAEHALTTGKNAGGARL